MSQLRDDTKDFDEFKYNLNPDELGLETDKDF